MESLTFQLSAADTVHEGFSADGAEAGIGLAWVAELRRSVDSKLPAQRMQYHKQDSVQSLYREILAFAQQSRNAQTMFTLYYSISGRNLTAMADALQTVPRQDAFEPMPTLVHRGCE